MTGIYWLAAFGLAAFACLSLGELPPSKLRWSSPRIVSAMILAAIGVAGLIADIMQRTGSAP